MTMLSWTPGSVDARAYLTTLASGVRHHHLHTAEYTPP